MKTALGCSLALAFLLLPGFARACDATLSPTAALASAERAATFGDFTRAADLLECAAAQLPAAMDTAVSYRIALGDTLQAQRDVRWLFTTSGPTESVIGRAFELGDSLEPSHQWTEASQWYAELARTHPARAQWAIQVRSLVGLGRAYAALGDLASATRSWQSADQLWPIARRALHFTVRPEDMPPPRPRLRRGEAQGVVSPYGSMTESGIDEPYGPLQALRDANNPLRFFAEARFGLARIAADRCYAPVALPGHPPTDRAAWERWMLRRWTPVIEGWGRCLEASTTRLLGVTALRTREWEVPAVALLAHLYFRFGVELIRQAPVGPPEPPGAHDLDIWY